MSVISMFLIFSMLAVMWFDITRYIIPNWLVGLLLAVYPAALFMTQKTVDWPMAAAGALIVFAVGYVIFARKLMGGGDIKLMVACALWVGWNDLLEYVFIVTLLGGALAVVIWLTRKALFWMPLPMKKMPRILCEGEPVPYGLAIASAFLIMLYLGRIPVVS
jgi:prepilin peptidase CpaA